jgi:hypothetical protein
VTKQQEDMVIERVYYLHEAFAEDWVDIADACAEKWEADAYRAVAASACAYRRWLCDDDPEVASQAAELLAWFTPTEQTVAALLSAHQSDAARASANLAVAHMRVSPTVTLEWMTPLLGHRSLVVQITASIALAYRLGPDLPDKALNILIDADAGEALPVFPLGWHERAPRGYVARALQHLGLG